MQQTQPLAITVTSPSIHVFHPPAQLSAWPEGDRRSRIGFITRDLERAAVDQAWSMVQPDGDHRVLSQ